MEITFTLNGKKVTPQIDADTLLIDLVRDLGCYSVKRGCETSNCGLCTVFMDDQPILSCSILAARVDYKVTPSLDIYGVIQEAVKQKNYDNRSLYRLGMESRWNDRLTVKADALLSINTETRNIADDTRDLIAQSYLELVQISENTGAIVKPIQQMQRDIAEVKKNTAKL